MTVHTVKTIGPAAGYVTAFVTHDAFNRSIAEAMELKPSVWMLNRLLVPASMRGQGVGGAVINALVRELKAIDVRLILVTPGGYDSDPERVVKFYKAHGFVDVADRPALRGAVVDALCLSEAEAANLDGALLIELDSVGDRIRAAKPDEQSE